MRTSEVLDFDEFGADFHGNLHIFDSRQSLSRTKSYKCLLNRSKSILRGYTRTHNFFFGGVEGVTCGHILFIYVGAHKTVVLIRGHTRSAVPFRSVPGIFKRPRSVPFRSTGLSKHPRSVPILANFSTIRRFSMTIFVFSHIF